MRGGGGRGLGPRRAGGAGWGSVSSSASGVCRPVFWCRRGRNTAAEDARPTQSSRAGSQVVYPTALHPDARTFDWDAPHRRIGGALAPAAASGGGTVALRVFVDHSAVEVFTGGGQALATRRARAMDPIPHPNPAASASRTGHWSNPVSLYTIIPDLAQLHNGHGDLVRRVYRGALPAGSDPGMFLVAGGGAACVDDLRAYELGSIWKRSEDRPVKVQEPAEG